MIFHGRLSDRNYGCRQRPRYLIFSQFSIGPILLPKCVCLRGSASDPTGGFRRPQLANVGSHHCRGPHRIAGPRAPRPHDPPLPKAGFILRTQIYAVYADHFARVGRALAATNADLRRSDRADVKYKHSYNTPTFTLTFARLLKLC